MIWQTTRHLISLILAAFYKRVQVKNIERLEIEAPVIIAMNHPNAFTDPLYFTYLYYPRRASFLARGDAFRPGLISRLLEGLGIVPIFRIQDGGKEGLKKNDESYQRVNALLKKNAKIIVFAEGLCIQERRLRPLKKGVARMVFGAFEALGYSDKLIVVPVGVNYSQPDKFRSDVFYNVGEPIPVRDFLEDYRENPARTYNKFLQVLEPAMKALITHIDDQENDEAVIQAETLCKRSLLLDQGLDPENLDHDHRILKQITEKVNQAALRAPEALAEFKPLARQYFRALEQHRLRDWLLDPRQNKGLRPSTLVWRSLLLLLGLPLYLTGLAGNYLPMVLTHLLTRKIVKHVEFYSSFAIGLGMVIFLIHYSLIFCLASAFSPHLLWPFLICLISALSAWFSLYYHPFLLKTLGMARLLARPGLSQKLSRERENLLSLINKF